MKPTLTSGWSGATPYLTSPYGVGNRSYRWIWVVDPAGVSGGRSDKILDAV